MNKTELKKNFGILLMRGRKKSIYLNRPVHFLDIFGQDQKIFCWKKWFHWRASLMKDIKCV